MVTPLSQNVHKLSQQHLVSSPLAESVVSSPLAVGRSQ